MAKKQMPKRPRTPEGKFLLQVFVDRDLHKKFKIRCLELDTTMADQLALMIKNFLRSKEA
jgi:hypothetical protein